MTGYIQPSIFEYTRGIVYIDRGHLIRLPIFCLIIFSTPPAILTFYQGIELLCPTRVSIISITEPLFTTISAMILFQERSTLS